MGLLVEAVERVEKDEGIEVVTVGVCLLVLLCAAAAGVMLVSFHFECLNSQINMKPYQSPSLEEEEKHQPRITEFF